MLWNRIVLVLRLFHTRAVQSSRRYSPEAPPKCPATSESSFRFCMRVSYWRTRVAGPWPFAFRPCKTQSLFFEDHFSPSQAQASNASHVRREIWRIRNLLCNLKCIAHLWQNKTALEKILRRLNWLQRYTSAPIWNLHRSQKPCDL